MNKYLTKRQMELLLVVLASIFFVALTLYSVFVLYIPAQDQKNQAAQQLSAQRDSLYALEKQLANKDPDETYTSQPLQKKVPVVPLEDGLLLSIEKAEVKSGSEVQNITFTTQDYVLENAPEEVQNLQTILSEVELEAETYSEVEQFIAELEKNERLLNIETIQFESTAEKTEQDSDIGPMKLVISFYAFFRPDLINLQNEAPKLDAPPPALKEDPTTINKMTGNERADD